MKARTRFAGLIAGAILSLIPARAFAGRVVYAQDLANESALAVDQTYPLDLGNSILPGSNVDSLSMQATYAGASISAVSFVDGVKSTETITVSSYSALVGAMATNTITVASNTYLTNVSPAPYFVLNGSYFYRGDLWNVGGSSATTAENICSAINTFSATKNAVFCSTTALGVCTLTSKSTDTYSNSYTLTSSSNAALTPGAATFSGGRNQGVLTINGVPLTQGTDFNAVTSNAVTATNLAAAINSAFSTINSTAPTGQAVIYATAAAVGSSYNYGVITSTKAALNPGNATFLGGKDSDVSGSVFTKTNHGLTTGLGVTFATVAASIPPQNLVNNTVYYSIRLDANRFQLATSTTNAVAGTGITVSTVTGGGSFILTPQSNTGTPSFKWQLSNDNTNWVDSSVSSVTASGFTAGTTGWDFGALNYRYIRLNFKAGTTGGLLLRVTGIGKNSQ